MHLTFSGCEIPFVVVFPIGREAHKSTFSKENVDFSDTCPLKGVDREKSAVFKELTPSFRTYELRGQAKKKL